MTKVNILHLSDLHFGIKPSQECSATALAKRTNTLDKLTNVLERLDVEWKPDIVTISGDIGWKGCDKDYQDARKWIEKGVLHVLGLSVNDLIVCAGNHDINREETKGMGLPSTPEEADDWLSIGHLTNLIRPFEGYSKFCQEFAIPILSVKNDKNELMGQRELKGLRFVVLNSAWFCRGGKDRGKLWIGLPQLKVMNAESQLADPENYDAGPITIVILHHPPDWFDDAENKIHNNKRINTFSYLSERSHIILSGHDHGGKEKPDRQNNLAYLFKGGARATS